MVGVTAPGVTVTEGQAQQETSAGFFDPRPAAAATASVGPVVQTVPVGLNEAPAPQYDLMVDLLHTDMFKVLSDMLTESGPPDPARQVSKVRISADDVGGYPRCLEY